MENIGVSSTVGKLVGDDKLLYLLSSLGEEMESKAIINGLKESAKPMLNAARAGYKACTASSANANKLFKIGKSRQGKPFVALVASAGIARWMDEGTVERYTKGTGDPHSATKRKSEYRKGFNRTQFVSAYRGSINPTRYFDNAVRNNEQKFYDSLSENLVKSIQKIVEKHANS
jgi:hypothetical protein